VASPQEPLYGNDETDVDDDDDDDSCSNTGVNDESNSSKKMNSR